MMSDRKRKHEAVSEEIAAASDDRDKCESSAAAANIIGGSLVGGSNKPAQLKEISDTLRSTGVNASGRSFVDLPPGIIGKIGTYIDLMHHGDEGNRTNDRCTLMSLCIAVGPQVASHIRKLCLQNNLFYLDYLRSCAPASIDDYEQLLDDTQCALVGKKLRQWMDHNIWWREACQSPSTFIANQKGNFPTVCKLIRLKDFADDEERLHFRKRWDINSTFHLVMPMKLCKNASSDKPFDENYNVVISVNSVILSPLQIGQPGQYEDQIRQYEDEMLAPGSDKEVLVMHEHFNSFFFNPALSISLGLFGLLQFQLEDLQLDVNLEWRASPRLGDLNLPLILHSMVQTDVRFFEYLLSFNGIDLNPIMCQCPVTQRDIPEEAGMTLLHLLGRFIGARLSGKFDMNRLKQLLSQDGVDINGGPPLPTAAAHERMTPLYALFCSPIKFDSDFDLVQTYLEAGANVVNELAVASSPGFDQALERGVAMSLQHMDERTRRFLSNDVIAEISVDAMRSKHQRIIAFVRRIYEERVMQGAHM